MIEIPSNQLDPEVLDAIIEAFILREGTDYGEREVCLSNKVAQVREDIRRGDVILVFDEDSESCTLVTKTALQEWSLAQ
jgi:uncharacterized protein